MLQTSKAETTCPPQGSIWDLENDTELELDIRYNNEEASKEDRPPIQSPETSDSKNTPLLSPKPVPGRFTPSNIQIDFGDETSAVIYNKKKIAQKTIARKTNLTTRGSLKP